MNKRQQIIFHQIYFKKQEKGSGETAESLSALTAVPESRFDSQPPHGNSQSSANPVIGTSSGFLGHQAHIWRTYIHSGTALIHIKLKN